MGHPKSCAMAELERRMVSVFFDVGHLRDMEPASFVMLMLVALSQVESLFALAQTAQRWTSPWFRLMRCVVERYCVGVPSSVAWRAVRAPRKVDPEERPREIPWDGERRYESSADKQQYHPLTHLQI